MEHTLTFPSHHVEVSDFVLKYLEWEIQVVRRQISASNLIGGTGRYSKRVN